jgi:hypothetical protein
MNQKRASSNLFWELYFVGCPRNTTPLRCAQGQTVLLTRANASQPPKCHSLSKKDLVAL